MKELDTDYVVVGDNQHFRGYTQFLGMYGNEGKGPVWWYPREKMYSDDNRPNGEELEELKRCLKKALDLLSI